MPQPGTVARPYRLRPHRRLRATEDFQRVYQAQVALHGPLVVVFFRPNGLPISRMGVSVGRKHGNAARRNRLKRILREAYRLTQGLLPAGYDYVLIPRRGVEKLQIRDLTETLAHLAKQIPLPSEGARVARARRGEVRPEAASTEGTKSRRGISTRTFVKRPPQNP